MCALQRGLSASCPVEMPPTSPAMPAVQEMPKKKRKPMVITPPFAVKQEPIAEMEARGTTSSFVFLLHEGGLCSIIFLHPGWQCGGFFHCCTQ